MFVLYMLLINISFYTVVFIINKIKKKHSLIDVFWGLSFVNLALWSLIITKNYNLQSLIIFTVIAFWGIRLSTHLIKRNWSAPEDYRYVNIVKKLDNNLKTIPLIFKEYVYIYMMQAGFSLMISTTFLIYFANQTQTNIYIFSIGIVVVLIGLFFEIVGDYQLRQYMKEKPTPVLNTGLWKYTRHPNYFGEVTIWYGVFLLTLSSFYSIFGIITPLTINFLIVKLSGIPLLENKMMKRESYKEYAKVTSKFIPRRPLK